MRIRFLVAVTLLSSFISAHAVTLASDTAGTVTSTAAGYIAQEFTAGGSGSYNDITFNFYTPSDAAYATGTGFLFSQVYTGTVAGLMRRRFAQA